MIWCWPRVFLSTIFYRLRIILFFWFRRQYISVHSISPREWKTILQYSWYCNYYNIWSLPRVKREADVLLLLLFNHGTRRSMKKLLYLHNRMIVRMRIRVHRTPIVANALPTRRYLFINVNTLQQRALRLSTNLSRSATNNCTAALPTLRRPAVAVGIISNLLCFL